MNNLIVFLACLAQAIILERAYSKGLFDKLLRFILPRSLFNPPPVFDDDEDDDE